MNVTYPIDKHRISSTSGATDISHVAWFVAHVDEQVIYPFPPVYDKFSEYEAYDISDWDGYGAAPISRETVQAARAFHRLMPMDAPRPDIAPGGDGTIGFEWRSGSPGNRSMILVDVGPGNLITARRVNRVGEIETLQPTYVETGASALVAQLFA